MRTRILIVAFVSSLLIQSSVFGQGALTPSGAPAPTMKTLSQVEPRTPISSAPFAITTPGSYYLTTNLVVSSGNAIDINAAGVTLDLNGLTISASSLGNIGTAISLDYANDITILNGHIESGVTNNGSGNYSGPGFKNGISWVGWAPQNVRISGVSVSGVLIYGINVLGTTTTLVEGCNVHTVGNGGIEAYIVKFSSAMDCGSYGIFGAQVSDCTGQATASGGTGIFANFSVQNSYGYATNGSYCAGIYCDGTALNCYGYSGGSGEGIFTETAANCYGYNVNGGTGIGLDAVIAENSYGGSTSGTALSAGMAQNSEGVTTSGTAVSANITMNCYGYVSSGVSGSYGIYSSTAENCYSLNYGTGTGIYASQALNCYSYCASGTAMSAFTATSCHAVTTSGTAYNVTHNVNSY